MDPIRTAVLNNRFAAVVEEASTAVYRTAHTTFVKLNQDYQCALATAEGDIFAYPNQSGVPVFIGISLRAVVEWVGVENLEPGDVIMTNDPWTSEGLCSHIMDVHMLRPIFRNGRLLGIAWAFVHASDIGGAVPGSISPHLNEVFQEGIRMRPVKLYRRGELNREIRDIFLANCRIPDEVWGDFKAMLSALKTMERRLLELCDRFGDAEIEQGMQDVMDFAEIKARRVIADIPDGEYRFNDYLEGLGDGEFIHMQTTLRVQGDTAEVDFTGTDPQVAAAYNIVSSDRLTHPYLTTALNYYILTKDP
ncbi:MAG: hydantoinase B/oxoprolinase family protein, partial [Rhodospirillales bacterium]|nr:hydantoinase B/oxoprolinase family protein [Rhodospirillales bacterium]